MYYRFSQDALLYRWSHANKQCNSCMPLLTDRTCRETSCLDNSLGITEAACIIFNRTIVMPHFLVQACNWFLSAIVAICCHQELAPLQSPTSIFGVNEGVACRLKTRWLSRSSISPYKIVKYTNFSR